MSDDAAPILDSRFATLGLRTDLAARAVYAEGAGIGRIIPCAVAVPRHVDDVRAIVAAAHDSLTPLVPRGSGSGMPGGNIGEGVIIDLSRLDWRGAVDASARRIHVGPGAVLGRVDADARQSGMRVPVDPSSAAFCTVGGTVSTNAAGPHTLRYGAMRRWVVALDCVFEDGARATVRRGEPPPRHIAAVRRFLDEVDAEARAAGASVRHPGVRKETSGYALAEYAASGDLVDLLVGSEGTLAVVVGVELALEPVPPATASVLAAFDTLERAVDGAALARAAGAAACELLDRTFLDVAREDRAVPAPYESEAVLLIEVEAGSVEEARAVAAVLGGRLREAGAIHVALGLEAADETRLWELRHAASPILARLDSTLASMQFVEDGCVPPERLSEYVRGVRGTLARHDTRGVIFGHAGDGHVHVNPLIDTSRPEWRSRVHGILADVVGLTARLGGTLAGEHGDGRLRTALIACIWGDQQRALFARVKHAFDPSGILNPGVKVPLAGQRALGAIKYDPSLPPLPSDAAGVLERVARERAYARSRLEMLEEARRGG